MDTAEGCLFVHAGIRPEMMEHLRKTIPVLSSGGAAQRSVVTEYINNKLLRTLSVAQHLGQVPFE